VVFSSQLIASGGLISYAIDFPDLYRRSAEYVDRILKGEKLADLRLRQSLA
jgi:putative ABC transport system substrate-binding protein